MEKVEQGTHQTKQKRESSKQSVDQRHGPTEFMIYGKRKNNGKLRGYSAVSFKVSRNKDTKFRDNIITSNSAIKNFAEFLLSESCLHRNFMENLPDQE